LTDSSLGSSEAQKKPIIVVANKIDHPNQTDHETEFSELGFDEVLPVSAAHGRGITELVERITAHLPDETADSVPPSPALKLAIVGRPNVGKSSLINAILKDRRTDRQRYPRNNSGRN